MEKTSLPEVMFLKVPVAHGMEAQVKLLLPLNIDKSGKKKYPLLVNVYVFYEVRFNFTSIFCILQNLLSIDYRYLLLLIIKQLISVMEAQIRIKFIIDLELLGKRIFACKIM